MPTVHVDDGRGATAASPDSRADVGMAEADAATAAAAAGVQVDDISDLADAAAAERVSREVWGQATGSATEVVLALANAGTTVLVARDIREPTLPVVGFAIGFLGWSDGLHLHSHQVGVVAPVRGRGVGYAIKLAQRARCLAHGITEMRWTYDPLLASNARFNLVRLGARPVAFLPNCYGIMEDAINGTDRSDRFEVAWSLAHPLVGARRPPVPRGTPVLAMDSGGSPRRIGRARPRATIAIPADYAALRAAGDPMARRWREVSGEVFAEAFTRGLPAAYFDNGSYVLAGDPSGD